MTDEAWSRAERAFMYRQLGMTYARIGPLLGVTANRVVQLIKQRDRTIRARERQAAMENPLRFDWDAPGAVSGTREQYARIADQIRLIEGVTPALV